MKIKIKLSWLMALSSVVIALCYPLSVQAATLVQKSDLTAPFIFSWIGVWVFSGAGGFSAGFIRVDEIDDRLKNPKTAKFFIGLFWGVGICLLIDALTGTPQGALTFFALAVSSFATPSTAGAMVWLSNQRRINRALNKGFQMKTGIDVSDKDDGQ